MEYVEKPIYAGTICLNAQANQANSAPEKNGSILEGKYLFLHNCGESKGWWYTCEGNGFKLGPELFTCSGKEISSWDKSYNLGYAPPETGSLLEIPSGTEIKNIGCSESNKEPVTGCSTTGVTMN